MLKTIRLVKAVEETYMGRQPMFMNLKYKYMGRQPMFMDLEQLCCQLPILPKAILDTFPIKFPVSFST